MTDQETVKLIIEIDDMELLMFLPFNRAKQIKRKGDGKQATIRIEPLEPDMPQQSPKFDA